MGCEAFRRYSVRLKSVHPKKVYEHDCDRTPWVRDLGMNWSGLGASDEVPFVYIDGAPSKRATTRAITKSE